MTNKEKVSEFLDSHHKELVTLVTELVRFPSMNAPAKEDMPYGEEVEKVLCRTREIAKEYGLIPSTFKNEVDVIDYNDEETAIGILAHLDVVPVVPEKWSYPPFDVTEKDGFLYGRGTSDDKGPSAAALFAMYALKQCGVKLRKNVRLYLGGNEECGSGDIADYVKYNKMPPYVFTPDASFPVGYAERGRVAVRSFGECETGKVISVSAGTGAVNIIPDSATAEIHGVSVADIRSHEPSFPEIRFDYCENGNKVFVTVTGKSVHAAMPQNGANALTALLTMLKDVDSSEFFRILSDRFPHGEYVGRGLCIPNAPLSISITNLHVQNGKFDFAIDGRVNLGEKAAPIADIIRENLPFPLEIDAVDPHYVSPDSPIVTKLQEVYHEVTGRNDKPYTLDAMTYAHEIEGGVIFGAEIEGDGTENIHTHNERYPLSSLYASAKMFAYAILAFCE